MEMRPYASFFAQFNLIARANHWEEETKIAVLVSYLRDKTRAVLESMQNLENLQFEELKSKLEMFRRDALRNVIINSLLFAIY